MAISRVGQVLIANGKAVGLSHFSSSVVFFLWHPFISTQENDFIGNSQSNLLSQTDTTICIFMCVNKTIFSMFNKGFKLKIYQ